MKIGDRFKVEIYPEYYDYEYGPEIVHNHIDCLVCKEKFSGTDAYVDLTEHDIEEISCQNCKTTFKRISDSWYFDNELEIIHLEEKYKNEMD